MPVDLMVVLLAVWPHFLLFSVVLFGFLGNINSFSLASGRITGAEAVAKMSAILGSPEAICYQYETQHSGFYQDHFGSMAVACAFGLAMRKMSS
jgi:hypothetical protein